MRHLLRARHRYMKLAVVGAATLVATTGSADEAAPVSTGAPAGAASEATTYPRVGGHLGFALPVFTIGDPVTVIGRDFVALGLTPGLTVKLSEKWAVDFEFVAMNELKNTPAATQYIVDPGVVYDAGVVSPGLRIATVVGAPSSIGLVPIIVVPVAKLGDKVTYYVEGDVPMFLRDAGHEVRPSIGFQFQSGFAF
jgi:hypothetical protein